MTRKIAISLSEETWRRAKSVVLEGRAESVSGYIASLIDREAEEETFAEMIARWNHEDARSAAEVSHGEAAVCAEFERAGLMQKGAAREGARRRSV